MLCSRVGGVLIPTRSFGDFLLKSEIDKPAWKQVISAVPQIQAFKLNSNWDFIVLGTDGVWDAMTNQEMITFIKSRLGSPDRPNANSTPIVSSTPVAPSNIQFSNKNIGTYSTCLLYTSPSPRD